MKNINVFGYATFGTPNGFTQSCIYGNKGLEKVLKTFDLKTNAIQLLSPNDRIYSIRKESVQNNIILSYSFYTYAKERNSNRSGTFIGTSLVFTNEILPENLTLKSLHEIHSNLNLNNVDSKSFVLNINHSKDFNLLKIFSKDFEKLEHQTTRFNFQEWENIGKNLVIHIPKFDQNEIQNLFKKSLQILPKYETIYFIDSKEIAEFVSQKRLFRIIDKNGLEQEIEILQNERKQKITNAISSLKNQKEKLKEEEKRELENQKIKIDKKEQAHSENGKNIQEDKQNLTKLENRYKIFSDNISSLISNLDSGKNLDEVNNSYKQYEKEFNEEKRKLNSSTQISSFSNSRSPAQVSPYSNPYEESHQSDSEDDEKKSSMKVVAIVSLILNILLIGSLTYLLYSIYTDNEKKITNAENFANSNENINSVEKDSVVVERQLNPIPNDIAKNNIDKIKNELTDNSTEVNDVVKIIFDKNKPIKNVYQFQKQEYADYLIKQNPDAFDSNNVLMRKDLLTKIPSFSETSVKKDSLNNSVSK